MLSVHGCGANQFVHDGVAEVLESCAHSGRNSREVPPGATPIVGAHLEQVEDVVRGPAVVDDALEPGACPGAALGDADGLAPFDEDFSGS